MSRFDPKDVYDRPQMQLIPLIDVLFFALIFFMVLSVYYHIESQTDIHIPESTQTKNTQTSGTEIVVNISSSGNYIINGRSLTLPGLNSLFHKLVAVSSQQSVIIRADQKAYHKYVIEVLDICARNNIRDISFATLESQK